MPAPAPQIRIKKPEADIHSHRGLVSNRRKNKGRSRFEVSWPTERRKAARSLSYEKMNSIEEECMPRNNTKRWLPITLILLCGINPITPMFANTAPQGQIDGQGLSGFNSCAANRSFEGTMFAVTVNNTLLNFNPGAPGVINSSRFINGLASGENVVGIEFRPADGRLYALTSASRLYTINPASGFAAPVGASFAPALSGQSFGVDFNPVPDRIRVVSDADQNLRLNPNNGAVAGMDTTLAYATGDPNAGVSPNVVGSAYTNNFAGATATTLYGIDSNFDTLVMQGSVGGAPTSPN